MMRKTNLSLVIVAMLGWSLPFATQAQTGNVKDYQKISDTDGNFVGILVDAALFGMRVSLLGDLDGDGINDIAVSALRDYDRGTPESTVWVLFLSVDGTVKKYQKINSTRGNFTGVLHKDAAFGKSLAPLGDLDGDGVPDLAVGAPFDDAGGAYAGAVWLLFLNSDGTVKNHHEISASRHGFYNVLNNADFGRSVTALGDLDGNGVIDLAVGAPGDHDGGSYKGSVWILFLNPNGTVKSHQKISATQGNFTGLLDEYDHFGSSVTSLGDLDGDGTIDLVVGDHSDDGGDNKGSIWVLFLNADGTVKNHQKISATHGNFMGPLYYYERFGQSVTALGDFDGDGVIDLAVGAPGDRDGGQNSGSVWLLFLNSDGTVKSHEKISATQGNFTGILDTHDHFGGSVSAIGDLNRDGVVDIVVGARGDDDGGEDKGAVWILFIEADVGKAIYYVDADATGANDGASWADAFNHLQDALSAAGNGDEIWVAQGIYKPDEDTAHPNGSGSRNAKFQLGNGVAIKGGFAGYGEPDPNAQDIELYETILSGDLNGDDAPNFGNNGENSYQVVRGDGTNETAVLDGFTITSGNANGSYPNYYGGGMYNYNRQGFNNPTITNCTFIHNWAKSGGAIGGHRSNPILTDCKFIGNSAGYNGGGMYNNVCDPTLINCMFTGNSAGDKGGAMYDYTNSDPMLINCTFNGNSAGSGGGINAYHNEPTLTNCILWGNSDNGGTDESAQIYTYRDAPVINYSCIQGWTGDLGGTGNINDDPLFVDAGNDDMHLLPTSPCIDAGDNTAVPAGIITDLDGNPRFVDQPEVPDTGNGTTPIVDMGAFEADYIKVQMKFTPQALNLSSGGQLVKAHFTLPEDFDVNDVDANIPAVIEPYGVESYKIKVLLNDEGLVRVEATFSRSDLCASITGYDQSTEVIVIGRLTTGQQFYGTDIIKITDRAFDHLAILVSHWLEADCRRPDWCDGADINRDSVVNFLDFALLDP